MLQEKIWLKWKLNTIVWGDNNYIWSEVYIVQKVTEAVGGGGGFGGRPGKTWSDIKKQIKQKGLNDEDVEKFLKVVVRVNDLTFDETRELTEKDLNKVITIEHIKNTISMVAPDVKTVSVRVNKKSNK